MNSDVHQRAQDLIAAALVEGLSAAEQAWLDGSRKLTLPPPSPACPRSIARC